MAQEIGVTLSVVRDMSSEEFLGWLEYLAWQNDKEREAFKKAKNGKGRR